MSDEELTEKQLGLNNKQLNKLKQLHNKKKFPETPFDLGGAVFRFAFALGLEKGQKIERKNRVNHFHWPQVFKDAGAQEIKTLVEAVSGENSDDIFKDIEEYAAWGVEFMHTNGYHEGMEMTVLEEYQKKFDE